MPDDAIPEGNWGPDSIQSKISDGQTLNETSKVISDSDKSAFIELISSFPIVGSSIAFLLKLSREGFRSAFAIFVLLLAYPILAFLIVLVILQWSPESIQSAARNFILSSLGVDEEVRSGISNNNLFIDFVRTISFSASANGTRVENVDLRSGQDIRIRKYVTTSPLLNDSPDCSERPNLPVQLGTVAVGVKETSYVKTWPLRVGDGELAQINSAFWEDFRKDYPGFVEATNEVTLEWWFSPSAELQSQKPGVCFDTQVNLALTVYKPNI